jgi:hypothetical protein
VADTALDLAQLLSELGFEAPSTQQRARTALIEAKLTNASKTRIDAAKRPRVEETLRAKFLVTCGSPDCDREANGRELVRASNLQHCWICQGSANRRASQSAVEAMKRGGIRRLVIVGGSPSTHDELRHFFGDQIEFRIVSGTERRTADAAKADLRWADLVLLWGSSELDHKVSGLYATQREHSQGSVLHVNRRGIAALLDAVVQHVAKAR